MSDQWRAALSAVPGNEAVTLQSHSWDAARVGPVHDMDTGALVVDLTPERIESALKAFEFQKARGIRVPFDLDHGTRRFAGDPVRGQVYGTVDGFAFDATTGKLSVKPSINGKGRALLGDDGGSYALSPMFCGALHDPKTGEMVSDCYIESIALTALPRQDGLNPVSLSKGDGAQPVMLAKFESGVEYNRFVEELRMGARSTLVGLGYTPDLVHIADWSDESEESGTLAASFWAGDENRVFIMDWSRAEDGAVTVTNARRGEARTEYIETETQQTEAAVALAKEAHMREYDITALVSAFAIAETGEGIALSKGDSPEVEVPEKVADILDIIKGKGESLRAELSKAQAELVKADARAEQAEAKAGDAVALSKRVDDAEAELSKLREERAAEKAAVEADRFVASLAKNGSISEGRIDKETGERVGDQRPAWRKRYAALGKDAAVELAAEVTKPGTYKPVVLGRGVGFDGPAPEQVKDDGSADIAAAAEAGMSVADYMLSKGGK